MTTSAARRRTIRNLVAAAALAPGGLGTVISRALAAGDLPGGSGVARLQGTATVNGRPARVGMPISTGDRIATGADSQAVVAVKGEAFLLRSNTIIEIKGREGTLSELVIAGGRLLSVFSKKPVTVRAAVATIGIRGTGAYLEVEPKSVYFCLCYGEAVVDGPRMESKVVKTTHHESPIMLREEGGIMRSEPGPFQNHSDDELIMLEALVGREPPFMKDGQYPAKRY